MHILIVKLDLVADQYMMSALFHCLDLTLGYARKTNAASKNIEEK